MFGEAVARWLIAESVGAGRPLPAWLRRLVDRTPSLGAYEAAQVRLNSALRFTGVPGRNASLASRISEALVARPSTSSIGTGALRPFRALAALATLAVVGVIVVQVIQKPAATERHAAAVPAVSRMLSRQNAVQPLVKFAADAEAPIQQELRALATTAENSLRAFVSRLPKLPPGRAEPSA